MERAMIEDMVASLYDGGWRAADIEDIITEYNLTADEADEVVAEFGRINEAA